jgi:hypothetical protein
MGDLYSVEKAIHIRETLALEYFNLEDYLQLQDGMLWKNDFKEFLDKNPNTFEKCGSSLTDSEAKEAIENNSQMSEDDSEIVLGIQVMTYEERQKELSDCETYAEEWGIQWLSETLKVNIVTWNADYNMFVLTRPVEPEWLCVLIANLNQNHFEQIGAQRAKGDAMSKSENDSVKWVFSWEEIKQYVK